MSIAEKLQTIAENEQKVYEAGETKGNVQVLEGTITEINTDTLTQIADNRLSNSAITYINAPNLTTMGQNACRESPNLTHINAPLLESIGQYAFYGCDKLTTVNVPLASTISNYAFRDCSGLTSVSFPMLSSLGTGCFYNDTKLEFADVGKISSIQSNTFYSNYRLTTLIIRTEALCSMANTNAFNYCYHILGKTHSTLNPTGAKDGYIYVPKALVDTYKTATNWVTYADQIRAIEDYPEITGG